MKMKNAKTKCTLIMTAALISIVAIGIAVLALRGRSTAAVPADGTSVERKVVKKKHPKKSSAPARAKTVEASPVKAAKSEPTRPEGGGTVAGGNGGEPPKAEGVDAENGAKSDNPFPRYLEMFRNDPAALAAEFEKEAEADRASLAKVREHAIAQLKLNPEQVAMFEKALGDLRDEVTRINEEWVGLIRSGQLNDEDDGSIFTSNRLLGQRFVAAHEKAMRETAEKLYEQLALDGVSDAEKQRWLYIAASRTASSYECLAPNLAVYDKVYKNFGIGDGIFSWCRRPHPQEKK